MCMCAYVCGCPDGLLVESCHNPENTGQCEITVHQNVSSPPICKTGTWSCTAKCTGVPHTAVLVGLWVPTPAHTHTHIHRHSRHMIHTHTHTYIHMYIHTHMHTHTHTHTYIHTHAHTHTYTHIHTHTCTHTHTHSLTYTLSHNVSPSYPGLSIYYGLVALVHSSQSSLEESIHFMSSRRKP